MEENQSFATSDTGLWKSPHLVVTDPEVPDEGYAITPSFDSADPIDARRTRRCDTREVVYSSDAAGKPHWQGNASTTKNSSIEARFQGSDIYWRAFHDAESGKADVYIDDRFQRTVNLYSPTPTGLFMSLNRSRFVRGTVSRSSPVRARPSWRRRSNPRPAPAIRPKPNHPKPGKSSGTPRSRTCREEAQRGRIERRPHSTQETVELKRHRSPQSQPHPNDSLTEHLTAALDADGMRRSLILPDSDCQHPLTTDSICFVFARLRRMLTIASLGDVERLARARRWRHTWQNHLTR